MFRTFCFLLNYCFFEFFDSVINWMTAAALVKQMYVTFPYKTNFQTNLFFYGTLFQTSSLVDVYALTQLRISCLSLKSNL